MSPTLLYILNVLKLDMQAQPNAYERVEPALHNFMRETRYFRNLIATSPIPWSY